MYFTNKIAANRIKNWILMYFQSQFVDMIAFKIALLASLRWSFYKIKQITNNCLTTCNFRGGRHGSAVWSKCRKWFGGSKSRKLAQWWAGNKNLAVNVVDFYNDSFTTRWNDIRACINNHIDIFWWDVFTHSCPGAKNCAAKPLVEIRHGFVITSLNLMYT